MFKYIIIILLVFTSFDAIGLQSRDNTTIDIKPVVDDSIVPVPVVIYQDTLFYISNGIGSHDINERANDIAQKAESLINDFSFEKKKFKIDSTSFTTFIKYENQIIIAIGLEDEQWLGKPRSRIAKEWLSLLGAKVDLEHSERSHKSILINNRNINIIPTTKTPI